jgi:hypothetical protein
VSKPSDRPTRQARAARCSGVRCAAVLQSLALLLCGQTLAATAHAGEDSPAPPYLSSSRSVESSGFWWPSVVFERGSTHLRGVRTLDETRFGLGIAYRSRSLSPHLRALISPSIRTYQNLAGMAAGGVRVHFELGGVPFSYGIGLSLEARLRDSLWVAYATPIEIGAPLYRGQSAEHYLFVGARHSMAGALINSFLLDPNGYDNEDSLDRLADLRETHAWQLYVTLMIGRRVE